ncbi:MAG: SAVED domain-containing protein, partial [Clostridia bacterium]|nr:SAVED domain-containing protein [Clostridia bacterium]
TSYNMSVYGIDNLHYIPNENVILFGESKFTSSLSKGITLVSKSLEKYEHQIKQEIELIFTQDKINQLRLPMSLYKDAIENFIDIETFIKKSDIHQLIVPLFIAHGVETSPQKIIEQLKKLIDISFLAWKQSTSLFLCQ